MSLPESTDSSPLLPLGSSFESQSFSVDRRVDSAVASVSLIADDPENRSEFYRRVASRLLQMANDLSTGPSATTPKVANSHSHSVLALREGPGSSSKRRRVVSLSTTSTMTESTQFTFDQLPPDVIISHIFRYFSGTFTVMKKRLQRHNEDEHDPFNLNYHEDDEEVSLMDGGPPTTFAFSLFAEKRLKSSYAERCGRCTDEERIQSSIYEFDPEVLTNPNVRCLWGYFCRDVVFRHPWFLFECLSLPSASEFYGKVETPNDDFLVPRVVISQKMLFSLKLPNFGGKSILPPSKGFTHLSSLQSAPTVDWLKAAIPVESHQVQGLEIHDDDVPLEELVSVAENWTAGRSLILRLVNYGLMKERDERDLHIAQRNDPSCPDFETLQLLGQRTNPWIRKLDFQLTGYVGFETIPEGLIRELRSLEHLTISSFLSMGMYARLTEDLWTDSLKTLKLSRVSLTWRHVLRTTLNSLEELDLQACVVDDEIFRIQALPRLKRLVLMRMSAFCENLTEEWKMDPSNLVELILHDVPIRVVDFLLQNGQNLKKAELRFAAGLRSTQLLLPSKGGWRLSSLLSFKFIVKHHIVFVDTNALIADGPTNLENCELCLSPAAEASFVMNFGNFNHLRRLSLCSKTFDVIQHSEMPHLKALHVRFENQPSESVVSLVSWVCQVLSMSPRFLTRLKVRLVRTLQALRKSLRTTSLQTPLSQLLVGSSCEEAEAVSEAFETDFERNDWLQLEFQNVTFSETIDWMDVFTMGVGGSSNQSILSEAKRSLDDLFRRLMKVVEEMNERDECDEGLTWAANMISTMKTLTDLRCLKQRFTHLD